MEPKTRGKQKDKDKGWSEIYGGQAFIIPQALVVHPNFMRLSPHAHKLIHDLARQFNPSTNGYLHPGFAIMKDCGWNSRSTLVLTLRELVHYGILVRTVQGGQNKPSYYGFSWRVMTEKPDRPYDQKRPVIQPSNDWLTPVPDFVAPITKKSLVHDVDQVSPPGGQIDPELVHDVDKQTLIGPRRGQVVAVSAHELVHQMDSYASMPYPMAADGLGPGRPAVASEASDSAVDVAGNNRRPTKPKAKQPAIPPPACTAPVQEPPDLALAGIPTDDDGELFE